MVCRNQHWIPKERVRKYNRGYWQLWYKRPCQDAIDEKKCQANKGHCHQYTDKGKQMDKTCRGTCGMVFR